MKMRVACLAAVMLLLFSAGCAKQSGKVTADAGTIADEIVENEKFVDQMSAIDQKTAVKIYGLKSEDVAEAKVYESTSATAEEAAVFEAKDKDAADRIKKAADTRIDDQKTAYQGYQPKEIKKLETPLLVQDGNYVVLVVADDTSAAKKVTDKYLK
ncbi:MAG: DUF4358 domain-containing protein [Oscillospiraceae bacterium]|jgi:hypothetical protein|nr:DUF4358 domain-containing protein [Oscillospiraceae bacterium]